MIRVIKKAAVAWADEKMKEDAYGQKRRADALEQVLKDNVDALAISERKLKHLESVRQGDLAYIEWLEGQLERRDRQIKVVEKEIGRASPM